MKLSMSAKDKFTSCSEMYRLHYIEKVRPIRMSSALYFGVAIDNALNHLLEHSKDNGVVAATKDKFLEEWGKHEHADNIDYFKSDLDISLLSEEECTQLDSIQNASKKEHTANWLSLRAKGLKLIEVYTKEILPKIVEVVSIQKNISIKGSCEEGNETEDEIIGIIDLEAKIRLDDGSIVHAILDNKTTSSPYAKNSVLTKQQTALYTYATGVKHAGFLTMNKKNFKTQCIVDVVPEDLQDNVIAEFIEVLERIKSEDFKKNAKNKCFQYGSLCSYYDYCWSGKMEGLTTKEERDK